jgi:hypothetical protein
MATVQTIKAAANAFDPELINATWRMAMKRIAKDPDLRKTLIPFQVRVPEGLIPAQAIASGKITPAQAKALLLIRQELSGDFADFAKDVRNQELFRNYGSLERGPGSIRTRFSYLMEPGEFKMDDVTGDAVVSPKDVGAFGRMIQEMSQGSLIARDATEPFTAYRSYTPLFGYNPSREGVLSFTESPVTMMSRWMGGNKMTWQPTRINPQDVTFDYGIGMGMRPEETEIQALDSLVNQVGGELTLEDLVRLGSQ